jgi:hypothetical protein
VYLSRYGKSPEMVIEKKELREGTPTTRIVDLHHFNADPDPGPHQSDANIRLLV